MPLSLLRQGFIDVSQLIHPPSGQIPPYYPFLDQFWPPLPRLPPTCNLIMDLTSACRIPWSNYTVFLIFSLISVISTLTGFLLIPLLRPKGKHSGFIDDSLSHIIIKTSFNSTFPNVVGNICLVFLHCSVLPNSAVTRPPRWTFPNWPLFLLLPESLYTVFSFSPG